MRARFRGVFFARRLEWRTLVGEFAIGILGKYRRIPVDQGKRTSENRRGGPAILLQHDPFGVGEVTIEELEGGARCATKAIDRLVGVSNGEDVALSTGEAGENLNLGEVSVLKFVGENEAGAGPRLGQNILVAVQHRMRARDHVAEGAEILVPEPALHRGEYAVDLAAASKNLG